MQISIIVELLNGSNLQGCALGPAFTCRTILRWRIDGCKNEIPCMLGGIILVLSPEIFPEL